MEHRALVVGVSKFGNLNKHGEVPPGSYHPLTFVKQRVKDLAAALSRFDYHITVVDDPAAADLGAAVGDALKDSNDRVQIVHVLSHGGYFHHTGKLTVVGSDGQPCDEHVERWLERVGPNAPLTLFLLDFCSAGEAARLPWDIRKAPADRRAWVLAATAPGAEAYDGVFSAALTTVLNRFANRELRTDSRERYHPWGTVQAKVRQEALAMSGMNLVTATMIDGSEADRELKFLPFLKNQEYIEPSELEVLKSALERSLAAFVDEIDKGLDPIHFAGRAGGNVVQLGRFHGRTKQLRELASWLREPQGGIRVVTGRPGVGKSALLGVVVCAGHPTLRGPTREIWVECRDNVPDEQSALAACHARQRSITEIIGSLGRQLRIDEPESAWTGDEFIDQLIRFDHPPFIVVDALDEAIGPAEVMTALLLPLRNAQRSDKSPACRLLIGTRTGNQWPHLKPLLDGLGPDEVIDLDQVRPAELQADLAGYLEFALCDWIAKPSLRRRFVTGTAAALTAPPRYASANEWGAFVVAGLLITTLIAQDPPADAAACDALVRHVPTTLPAVVDLDMMQGDRPTLRRAVLTALAFGVGEGMPQQIVTVLAPVLRMPVTIDRPASDTDDAITEHDVAAALDASRFYLRTSIDTDGATLYRLFHQGLADHLIRTSASGAQPAIFEALLEHVTDAGCRRWDFAVPYLLRHIFDHAVLIEQVVGLLDDTELLVYAEPRSVSSHLNGPAADYVRLVAAIYQTSRRLTWYAAPRERRQLLAVQAAQFGAPDIARSFSEANNPLERTWRPRWAARGGAAPIGSDTRFAIGTLAGNTDAVTVVATITLDGQPIAVTAGQDGAVRIWNLHTRRPVSNPIKGRHFGGVTAITTITLDGQPIAVTAGRDHTLRIWNLHTREPIGNPIRSRHFGGVTAIATITLDGRLVAVTASEDGTARIWNLHTRKPIGKPLDSRDGSTWISKLFIRFVKGGYLDSWPTGVATTTLDNQPSAVTVGHDGTVRIWNLHTRRLVGDPLNGHEGGVMSVATTAVDGKPVAVTAGRDGAVRIWNLHTGEPIGDPLKGHNGRVTAVATITLDGKPVAVTAGRDGAVRIWNLHTGRLVGNLLEGHLGGVTAVATTTLDNEPFALTTGNDGVVRIWNLHTGRLVGNPFESHEGGVTAVATTTLDNQPVALTAGYDGVVRIRNLHTGRPVGKPLNGREAGAMSVATTALDGDPVAVTAGRDGVRIWNLHTGRPVGNALEGHNGRVMSVATTALDGNPVAVTAGRDGVRIWNLHTREPIGDPLKGHNGGVTAVVTTTLDNQPVALTIGYDGAVRIWNLRARCLVGDPLKGREGGVMSVATTAVDGDPVAVTAGRDGVRIWNLHTREPIGDPLKGRNGGVTAVATTTLDNQPVAVAAALDGAVRIWNLRTHQPIDEFMLPDGATALAVQGNLLVAVFGIDVVCLELPERTTV